MHGTHISVEYDIALRADARMLLRALPDASVAARHNIAEAALIVVASLERIEIAPIGEST
jgi:hypothetical protein